VAPAMATRVRVPGGVPAGDENGAAIGILSV